MILTPEIYPSSRQEAIEWGWVCEGIYSQNNPPPSLFSEKMGENFYVTAVSFTATGRIVSSDELALWVKPAPRDGMGRPLSYFTTTDDTRVVQEEAE